MRTITGIVGKMSGKVCWNGRVRAQIGLSFIENVKKVTYSLHSLESLMSISLIFKQNILHV